MRRDGDEAAVGREDIFRFRSRGEGHASRFCDRVEMKTLGENAPEIFPHAQRDLLVFLELRLGESDGDVIERAAMAAEPRRDAPPARA